jgi:fimbrial isopeptide formation D2 family protein/LPXTG-motif cell wall-anchored protein
MKKFTKLLGIVLIMALVMSMGTMAFAAGEPTDGTITIKSSENGTTYNFYRLFDLALHDLKAEAEGADPVYESYIYSINETWHDFFTDGAGAAYLVDTNTGSLNSINVDGTIKYININSSNVVAFTNAAMDYALDEANGINADTTATGTGSDVEVDVDTLGYYLMIPVDAKIKTVNSSGSIASLTTTDPDVDIAVKAIKPKIEKTDDKITVDLGETVTYTLKGVVPNMAGYTTFVYKISDTMSSGLTFNEDVTVTIGGVAVAADTAAEWITYANNGFVFDFPVDEYQEDNIGDEIVLTYTAFVNENAITSTVEKNKAQLEYGHNPKETEKTTPVEEEVYTAKVIINKYTGNDKTAASGKLADAKFALMNSEGKYYHYVEAVADDATTPDVDESVPAHVEWVTVAGAPTSGTASVTDAQAKALADDAAKTATEENPDAAPSFTAKTTNSSGAADFPGIKDDTYYLVEFAAPTGYNRLDKPVAVTVAGTNADTATGKVENKADATGSFDAAVDSTADVQNNAGTELPSTGGIGTTIFYVVGSIMVVAAGVLLITKKRMSREG